jgi:DNA-binding CsgD family transcriptional regulator
MPSRRRLSDLERLEIVRETLEGVSSSVLAKRLGVTTRTIQYTIRRDQHRKRDSGIRTEAVHVTLTPEELEGFDALLARQGIKYRSDGLRRLIQSANGVFLPDEQLASELSGFRAALNRVGNNVTQIAKRMNEANNKGMKPLFGKASLAQMRVLAGFVLDFADQIDHLVRRRTDRIDLVVDGVLKELADGEK